MLYHLYLGSRGHRVFQCSKSNLRLLHTSITHPISTKISVITKPRIIYQERRRYGSDDTSKRCTSTSGSNDGNQENEYREEMMRRFEKIVDGRSELCAATTRTSGQDNVVTEKYSIDRWLDKPYWSIRELMNEEMDSDQNASSPSISDKELQRLLRLSALPSLTTPDQTESLRRDLQSQLKFVRHIQRVNVEGVEPLVCVRNETYEGLRDSTITLEDLQPTLSKEYQKGKYRRPRRRVEPNSKTEDDWDVFATSENVTEVNGEKYFLVRQDNPAPETFDKAVGNTSAKIEA